MKRILVLVALFMMATFATSYAAIITVDNKTPSIGDYSSLQAAHDAANPGDTIYVCPSAAAYSAITVTKTLYFVGTGFEAPSEGMNTTSLKGTMTFGAGSDGSRLEGFGKAGDVYLNVDANDITIKRNSLSQIVVYGGHTGTVILQNYLSIWIRDMYLISVQENNEVLVANNILISGTLSNGIGANHSGITITVLHNVINTGSYNGRIALSVNRSNKHVENNIIVRRKCQPGSDGYLSSDGYYYNISCNGECLLPEGNGNINYVDANTLFADLAEHDYHLQQPDSPAIGTGRNGVDMGAYGGSTPFIDRGAPSLPSISELQSDHVGAQSRGLDVVIKAKTNPE